MLMSHVPNPVVLTESSSISNRDVSFMSGCCLGKNRCKAWTLAIILFLACWSMLSASAGLAMKWYGQNPLGSGKNYEDIMNLLDPLEMEVREKIVRHAWDRYVYNPRARLGNFWYDAFEAAYEDLDTDDNATKDAAIREIARLSLLAFEVDLNTGRPVDMPTKAWLSWLAWHPKFLWS
ncbi:hypothetical protein O6H91_05G093100 [Diphasiastrum complanatum]|uniref:Uncharacterized protein n=1 Tax=Diphasiastrum complanatum TaxID=34168 RepID=A0ACC2DRB2_DIPCM|nr:hypothetical protein O6H91_05G093100 [Diphasiastrum complanatum]